jgi:predicted regulator of Ras-like GTPase activity (Roadblock/LC7/MglB family)
MSKAHEIFLQDLMRTAGVKSAMLVNNRGEALLSTGQFTLNSQSTVQIGVLCTQIAAIAETPFGQNDEVSMVFSEGRITAFTNLDLMIETSYGTQEVFPIVISAPNANLPTMRMTVKVAADKLKKDKAVAGLKISVGVLRRNLLTRDRLDATGWELLETLNRS